MPLFFRLACWTGPEHFASTPLCYQHEGRSTLRLAPNRLNQATVTISLQSLPLSKAHFPADYRPDSLDCPRRSKLCSGLLKPSLNYWRVISNLRHPWKASSASSSFQLDKAVYIFSSLKVNMDLVQRNTHKDTAHTVTDDHATGVYVPYSLKRAVHILWRPTRIKTVKERWDRA